VEIAGAGAWVDEVVAWAGLELTFAVLVSSRVAILPFLCRRDPHTIKEAQNTIFELVMLRSARSLRCDYVFVLAAALDGYKRGR
jgi:hypothetical protein